MSIRSIRHLAGLVCVLACGGCASAARVQLQNPARALALAKPALYPETLEVNPLTGKFLVGSVHDGAVYEVGADGSVTQLVRDDRLTMVLGIAVDAGSNRLLVTNSDLGASVNHSSKGAKKEAGVGIYDLRTGHALHYVDLTPLVPGTDHLINGITIDAQGNAYVTDSFSPVIYKVDPNGRASVFLQDAEFEGPGINLNGIVYHPAGFLLVVKKSSGALYRIPLDDPRRFARIETPMSFKGGDGLLLIGDTSLVLVANKTPDAVSNSVFLLSSHDAWATAAVLESKALGEVYPTTSVAAGGRVYVLSSHLDEWLLANAATRDAVAQRARLAEIRVVGVLGDAAALPAAAATEPTTVQPPPAAASAQPTAAGIRRSLIRREPAHEPGWETRLYLIEYPPGVSAPLHVHPAVGVGWVVEGEFEHAFGDAPVSTVKAGEGFTDQAEVQHRVFRNPSPDHNLRFIIAYTMRAEDEPFRLLP